MKWSGVLSVSMGLLHSSLFSAFGNIIADFVDAVSFAFNFMGIGVVRQVLVVHFDSFSPNS